MNDFDFFRTYCYFFLKKLKVYANLFNFQLIGFYASDEKRLTFRQGFHQSVQRLLELNY